MSITPFLSDYTEYNNSSPRVNVSPSPALWEELDSLKNTACARKCATKAAAVLLCPLNTAGAVLLGTIGCIFECSPLYCCVKEQDIAGTPYCPCTSCKSWCWEPAPLPQSRCDIAKKAFDACVYCVCCTDEKPADYLLGWERRRLNQLEFVETHENKKLALDETTPLPIELTRMVLSHEPLHAPPSQEPYRTRIPTPPPSRSDWSSNSNSNRWEWRINGI